MSDAKNPSDDVAVASAGTGADTEQPAPPSKFARFDEVVSALVRLDDALQAKGSSIEAVLTQLAKQIVGAF